MFKKNPLKSQKIVVRRRRIFIAKLAAIFIVLAGIVFGLAWVSRLDFMKITAVEVKGNEALDAREIQEIANNELTGAYYNLFSKSNRFLYPKETITAAIQNSFKRISSIGVSSKGLHTIEVTISERKPSYTWCAGTPTDKNKKCYFIDSRGYIFSEAPTFSGHIYFSFYGSIDADNPIGTSFLDESKFRNLDKFLAILEDNSLEAYALQTKDSGTYEIYLEKGGKILVKEGQDVSLLNANIKSLVEQTGILTKKLPNLDYVDLRFGNKVFYKMKAGDNTDELNP